MWTSIVILAVHLMLPIGTFDTEAECREFTSTIKTASPTMCVLTETL